MGDVEDSLYTKIGNDLTNDTKHGTDSSDSDNTTPRDNDHYGASVKILTARTAYGSYGEERNDERCKDEMSGQQTMSTTAPKAAREKSLLLIRQGVPSTTLSTEISRAKTNNSENRMSATTSTASSWRKYVMDILISPNIIAVFVGITISSVPFLQESFFTNPRGVLWPIGAAVQVSVDTFLQGNRVGNIIDLAPFIFIRSLVRSFVLVWLTLHVNETPYIPDYFRSPNQLLRNSDPLPWNTPSYVIIRH